MTEKGHQATLDKCRSLYGYGFYDAVAHAALRETAAAIDGALGEAVAPRVPDVGILKAAIAAYGATNQNRRDFFVYLRLKATGDADARDKTLAGIIARARRLRPRYLEYGPPAVAALRKELLHRQAEYIVTAVAKAPVQQRFGGGPTEDEPTRLPTQLSPSRKTPRAQARTRSA
eukprot:jgi/Tetstr1/442291/TSEL_030432.t1